ncbi:flagellar brake protein [Vibrio sinensis]|uniref:flagellar brake protein n=1 Tax=Vibrio sinensis TaxID=2302434 RepID=UPI003F6DE92A
MNQQVKSSKDATTRSNNSDKNTITINSQETLGLIEHGSELIIGITTPVGTTFRTKTAFIGTHSHKVILAELPNISDEDLKFFFQEGFWTVVRAISPRGQGGMIQFRSQISHVVRAPFPMMALSIPSTMQLTPLRTEPRYDVNLPAKAHSTNHRIDCDLRDLSRGGCQFVTSALSRPFDIGESVELHIVTRSSKNPVFDPLFGSVCNIKPSPHNIRYGIKLDIRGKNNAKKLLSQLKFDGSKLTLRS